MKQFNNFIAIIDDGVNESSELGKLKYDIEITEQLEIIERKNSNIFPSHSTTCATIIKKYAPEAVFASIKILNENYKALKDQLVKALEWCVEKQVRLVNLSLGTIDYRDYESIKDIVNKAYYNGLIIVAACNNKDIFTYPASLENVIGVKSDKTNFLQKGEYVYHDNPVDGINISTSPYHDILNEDIYRGGYYLENSFAAPRITALVSNMISENPDISFFEIKKELWRKSKKTLKQDENKCLNITRRIDWADNSLLIAIGTGNYPFDKVQFPKFIKDKAVLKADSYSDKILQSVEEKINKSIDDIETVVLFIDNDFILKADDEERLINRILKLNKNIAYLNDRSGLADFANSNFTNRVWVPFLKRDILQNEDILNKTINEIPIILINDFTESKNIAELVELIDNFKREGYYAIALSEFSMSILFGFEYLSHQGYTGKEAYISLYIKNLIRSFDPDLLFVIINGKIQRNDYIGILKEDLKPDITFNLLQSHDDIKSGFNYQNEKVINIFTGQPNEKSKFYFDNTNNFSIYNTESIYRYIIKTFESNK